ncbi:hypothetical protein ACN23B_12250 [Anabaena sp. FACHB-709]|uniref:HEPN domain-containing protein n=2 Tax=Nostocaceae TaxID=1162 RepID=A0A1Z4KGE7_ANAVA|nr:MULTISPECIES: hypothetical protein [Nostocaceae]BAY68060.1 hypothetical protein NIES23_08430 [Trichormus variabilis NIES-23]HBW29804.1 hypothetical protein [Nostoc sp. UBA8866]MBD2169853.1 hypothetical protein [Anabaena cylindrica FACHB-318]MBD2261729.1 hypothetical protein [Anabaena sp. FACHB-709]MBD2271313.1 hypothetical protein [Nostoc sp. PCC 7120 = FACHB-418]
MIGKLNHNVNVSQEYEKLAREDEKVGLLLQEQGEHRHSIYFLIQAMEKYVRAKIFTFVDAKNPYFRKRERTHSIEDALDFLIEVISGNTVIREQVKNQLREYVVGEIKFNWLHNNLRYPFYSERYNSYSSFEITSHDNDVIAQKLKALKAFLADIDRFR